jgi:hypothetical protein
MSREEFKEVIENAHKAAISDYCKVEAGSKEENNLYCIIGLLSYIHQAL